MWQTQCAVYSDRMQAILTINVLCAILMLLATSVPTLADSDTLEGAVDCKAAGWASCCVRGECYVPARECFCDVSCHVMGDCCADIANTCPLTTSATGVLKENNDICTTGEVRITGDMSNRIEMCVKGIFVSVCTGSCEHIGSLNPRALLHIYRETLKRQVGGAGGSGSGASNIVGIGLQYGSYTVSESDLEVVLCTEVKSGFLAPSESVVVTIATSSGTALSGIDYEGVEEDISFDDSNLEELLCIAISITDDIFFEETEHFSVTLSSSCPNVVLDEELHTATVFIESTAGTSPEGSCVAAGFAEQCCEGLGSECQPQNVSCSCDRSCLLRTDCCEDIRSTCCAPGYAVMITSTDISTKEDEGSIVVCAFVSGTEDLIQQEIVAILHVTGSQLAVPGEDYVLPQDVELVFTAGQPLIATQCVDIGIVDDDNVEGEHDFTVEIVSVSPSSVLKCSLTTITVHITDNDVAEVSLIPINEPVLEEDPLSVCAFLSGVNYTETPIGVPLTISGQGTLQKLQVTFPTGQVASGTGNTTDGLIACSTVLVDNDVLDWSWQLTASLDILNHDQLTLPPLAHSSFPITVVDDEAQSASVHFQSASGAVIEGQHAVVCVLLDGVPAGGMARDLSVSLSLKNSTPDPDAHFSLLQGNNASIMFSGGSSRASVETAQCRLIDMGEIDKDAQCRGVHFSVSITSTTPELSVHQPNTTTVYIRDSNGTGACQTSVTGEESDGEALYFALLLGVSALTAVLVCTLLIVVAVFSVCCHFRHREHQYSEATPQGYTETALTIQNNVAYNTYDDRSTSVPTYESFRAATPEPPSLPGMWQRSRVLGSPAPSTSSHEYEMARDVSGSLHNDYDAPPSLPEN